jgi:dTMP kinase
VFVTFEGLDGSGKTTQAAALVETLRREGREVVETREPGGTELGERIRELLLGGGAVSPWAEAALFAAARAELVEQVIRPAIARGADVVCDRYLDSSLAYQGLARGLGLERVLELNLAAVGGLLPDWTALLVVPAAVAAARRPPTADRIEREGLEFAERVEDAYRDVARRFPERILVFDGTQDAATLAHGIRERLRDVS